MKKYFYVVLCLVLCLAACTADTWKPVAGGENLTADPSWACTGWIGVTDGVLDIGAGNEFRAYVNTFGPRVQAAGDFGVRATISADAQNLAAFSLVGKVGVENWWNEVNKLDVGLEEGHVVVNFYDGKGFMPRISQTFSAEGLTGQVQLELRRVGKELIVYANNKEVGRLADPDIMPDGRAYFGASVRPNNTLHIHQLSVIAPRDSTGVTVLTELDSDYTPTDPPLRDLADARHIYIGGAVEPHYIRCDPVYGEVLGREFNILVTENAFKFWSIHPAADRYTFEGADAIVQFAEANNMKVRGHTLLWHQSMPDWIQNADFTPAQWEQVIHDHIATVVGRYKGRVAYWDVLNEAINDEAAVTGTLRKTVWSDGLGADFIDKAFIWAHEADPDALLFYNDYGAEDMGGKSDQVYALVKGLVERGVPIHGVGLQMHLTVGGAPKPEDVQRNMQRLGELGLQVHITELDIRLPVNASASLFETQARMYREYLEVCLAAKNCTAFVLWGFTDRYSWIPNSQPGFDHALIFDKMYRPKPAYFALREALTIPKSLGPEDFGATCDCEP